MEYKFEKWKQTGSDFHVEICQVDHNRVRAFVIFVCTSFVFEFEYLLAS